jgi:hypothetical protein
MRDSLKPRILRAERRAAPEPARIPAGDRPRYRADEGLR